MNKKKPAKKAPARKSPRLNLPYGVFESEQFFNAWEEIKECRSFSMVEKWLIVDISNTLDNEQVNYGKLKAALIENYGGSEDEAPKGSMTGLDLSKMKKERPEEFQKFASDYETLVKKTFKIPAVKKIRIPATASDISASTLGILADIVSR